jgi:hypothetical protein
LTHLAPYCGAALLAAVASSMTLSCQRTYIDHQRRPHPNQLRFYGCGWRERDRQNVES